MAARKSQSRTQTAKPRGTAAGRRSAAKPTKSAKPPRDSGKPAKPAPHAKAGTRRAVTASAGSGRPTAKRKPARPLVELDRLHQVAIVAADLDRAVQFYSEVLGLPFIARFDPPGLAFFDLGGGVRLLLSATASAATLYFHVKDMSTAVKTLSGRGVSFLQKPAMIHRDDAGHFGKKGQEEWMAFFRDPSANLLALVARK